MSNQAHSFVGNLTRDPEVRTVASKKGDTTVVSFSVAVNGRTPEETVYFDCEAWAEGAELIAKWFKKGKAIVVNDAIARNDTWNDKTTGEKRSRMKFRVNRFGFAPGGNGNKEEEPEAETPTETPKTQSTRKTRTPAPPVTEPDDEDIPF